MFGLGGVLGGGGGGLSASSSASTGAFDGGDTTFGNVGGFGSFAVGSNADASGSSSGSSGGGSGGKDNIALYVAGGVAALAVLAMLIKR